MKWQRIAKSPRRRTPRQASGPVPYRLTLDRLEDRTLPTVMSFNLDPSSSLSLAGSEFLLYPPIYLHFPITEQAAGSLTTTQEGTIAADVDFGAGTIHFLDDGSGAIAADISGSWQPGVGGVPGTAPANYGGFFQVTGPGYLAIRNNVDGLSTAAPVALTDQGGGAFSFPSNQRINVDQGDLDYESPPMDFGSGRASIVGWPGQNNAAAGTLQDNGDGTYSVTVPVNGTITDDFSGGNMLTIQVTGTLTGTTAGPATAHPGGLAQVAGARSGVGDAVSGASSNLVSAGTAELPAGSGDSQAGLSQVSNQAAAPALHRRTVGGARW